MANTLVTAYSTIILAGRPNAGKSALFNRLSGAYAAVSNYPGTTVEVARAEWEGREVVDTPGMHAFLAHTEEELVSRRLIMEVRGAVIVHVADARNLDAHLPLTLQLMESGFPVILAANMADEAAAAGLKVDAVALSGELGIPVILTSAVSGEGIEALKAALRSPPPPSPRAPVRYPPALEIAAAEIAAVLPEGLSMAPRLAALLLLEGDHELLEHVAASSPAAAAAVLAARATAQSRVPQPLSIASAVARHRTGAALAARVVARPAAGASRGRDRFGDLLMHPLWGGLAAVAVLYFGLYVLVGKLGSGVLVNWLENDLFLKWLNPGAVRLAGAVIPWEPVRDLVTGEFGIFTLGVRYAVAIILPLVTMFFLVFALIEDSGYLPRLAMLLDALFKRIGLSGRAVIPMVLGFGCDTMATLVTRTLSTRRERLIATVLLALAIPCSAQLGVILGLLEGHAQALAIWFTVLAGAFLLVGWLGALVIPGEASIFFMEVPPLRWPLPGNVWRKTSVRVIWYMREVVPLFIYVSLAAWVASRMGILAVITSWAAVPLGWMGLPPASAPAFVFGFIRRDYGAAGLYDLNARHGLTVMQLAISSVVLTLFLPCIAQFMMMGRERSWKIATWITVFVGFAAFAAGLVLARVLPLLGGASW
ncbi:MAG: ferrous iron transport protein B [Candidatus Coatesbacteria bacterium]